MRMRLTKMTVATAKKNRSLKEGTLSETILDIKLPSNNKNMPSTIPSTVVKRGTGSVLVMARGIVPARIELQCPTLDVAPSRRGFGVALQSPRSHPTRLERDPMGGQRRPPRQHESRVS